MGIQIKDTVLIKALGVKGKVIGVVEQEHNKANKGDLRVAYWQFVRGEKTRLTEYFSPDKLDIVERAG